MDNLAAAKDTEAAMRVGAAVVVAIGVVGGAILFGTVGMLLAIPAMTVFKALVSSTARQLRAYGLT